MRGTSPRPEVRPNQAALVAEPGRVSARQGLVRACEEFERWDQAAEVYRKVAELSEPERVAALARAGGVGKACGVAEAEAELQRLQAEHPGTGRSPSPWRSSMRSRNGLRTQSRLCPSPTFRSGVGRRSLRQDRAVAHAAE